MILTCSVFYHFVSKWEIRQVINVIGKQSRDDDDPHLIEFSAHGGHTQS